MDELILDPTAEIDLGNEGLQPTRADWYISGTTYGRTKADNADMVTVNFESLDPIDGIDGFRASAYFVVNHPTASVAKGGRGGLKKLFLAVFGTATGAITDLEGKTVSAEVKETDDGFRNIGSWRPAAGSAVEAGDPITV